MRARLGAVLLAALAAACAGAPARRAAPDLALRDLAGRTVALSSLLGRPLLLDFWAPWCDPCRASIPHYEGLAARGLRVVGVAEDDPATVAAFVKTNGPSYAVLLDPDGRAMRAFGARGLPTVFLLDARGRVRGRWSGFDASVAAAVDAAAAALPADPGKR